MGVAEAPDRRHVALLVELEALGVHGPVEVDGELRHAQQRAVDVDEPGGAVAQREPAGEAEVAVEPGVEQRAAVDLDGDLPPAVRARVGDGLDAQVGGVRVGSDDAVRGGRGRAARYVPGDDRAASEHVLAAGALVGPGGARGRGPRFGLGDLAESGLLQPRGRVRHRVVRRRARGEEGHHVVGVAAIEAVRRAHGLRIRIRTGERTGSGPLCEGIGPRPRGLPSVFGPDVCSSARCAACKSLAVVVSHYGGRGGPPGARNVFRT